MYTSFHRARPTIPVKKLQPMTGLTFNKTEAGFNTSRRDVSDSLRLEPINEYYTENLVKKK